ncbi:CHRD domain-containing protein [Adhaeribacter sp. BT258]|uniref:CHRD domain-containing protein n=1 Tax=Adhaeribacter terrigena TaxID=2793070 RepID=A0ABS1C2Z0_9BACT|nr:CHRD domain-containing protein [Adhaeribacter terrigena]MBK0403768.1 CHRD domain-containing protein [Adhaeribacter terrigena]
MKRIYAGILILICCFLPVAGFAAHLSPNLLFSAKLDGAQEVPAVTTTATGVGSFMLNGTRDTLYVNVSVAGLSGPITAAHIHEGLPGVAGPVVIDLVPFIKGNLISGYITGAALTPAVITKHLQGVYYVNVHTAANPSGEIRGQIMLETDHGFIALLNGLQEVPPVATTATGIGTFLLSQDRSKIKVHVIFEGLSGAVTGAHLHTGAIGVSGPVVLNLTTMVSGNEIVGEGDPTPFLAALLAGTVYINIHTAANPNGEIRGQLFMPKGILMDAHLDGAQEVPPVATNAKGVAGVRINATLDSLEVAAMMTGLSGPMSAAHFHTGAVGVAGPIAINLTPFISGNRILGKLPLAGLPANTVNMFLTGDMYLNVHTAANPSGEIRGQVYRLSREGYTLVMNGKQEVPPVNTPASGSGLVSIDRDQTNAHYMMVWSGLSGPATAAHFHLGKFGVAGPVIFNLTPSFNNTTNPTAAAGYWHAGSTPPFTTRNSVQFRSDSMYVNVHTAANPSGEIRGQVLRGARNLSKILGVRSDLLALTAATVYPNPSSQIFKLKLEVDKTQEGVIRITDVLGKTVYENALKVPAGKNVIALELGFLTKGIYQLEFTSGEIRTINRLVKE